MNPQTLIVLRWLHKTHNTQFFAACADIEAFRHHVEAYFYPMDRAGSPAEALIRDGLDRVEWSLLYREISPP
jgi:hypothetical protein